jgi:hypothetical protein
VAKRQPLKQMGSIDTVWKQLDPFVKVKSIDSVRTHLKQIFLFENEDKICGSFDGKEIKLWMSSNPLIGACYPIVRLKLNVIQDRILLTAKMNPVGLIIAFLINVAIIWASLNMFILREGLSADSILQRILVFTVFIGIFNFPIYMSYKGARDVIMKEIEDRIKSKQPLTQAL